MTLRTDSQWLVAASFVGPSGGSPPPGPSLPCQTEDADLWFAERPAELGRAQRLCRRCPVRVRCLEGALRRGEPWGVWGGQIFDRGRVVPFKRGRGRPAKPKPGRPPSARANRNEPKVA